MNQRPWEECPSFDVCSVNACPLRPDYLKLRNDPDDPETKCHAQRAKREEIALRYPGVLPTEWGVNHELTKDKRSLAMKARWNALTPEEQENIRDKLAKGRTKLKEMK